MPKLEIPKRAIDYIIGRIHVGKSDDCVKAEIRKRTTAVWTEADIKRAERYALKVHHANRDLYHAVMTGNLGGKR